MYLCQFTLVVMMSDRVVRCPFADDTLVVPEESFAETIWRTMDQYRDTVAAVGSFL